jgi:hypothetical protein
MGFCPWGKVQKNIVFKTDQNFGKIGSTSHKIGSPAAILVKTGSFAHDKKILGALDEHSFSFVKG